MGRRFGYGGEGGYIGTGGGGEGGEDSDLCFSKVRSREAKGPLLQSLWRADGTREAESGKEKIESVKKRKWWKNGSLKERLTKCVGAVDVLVVVTVHVGPSARGARRLGAGVRLALAGPQPG